jgi:hypothetical protein
LLFFTRVGVLYQKNLATLPGTNVTILKIFSLISGEKFGKNVIIIRKTPIFSDEKMAKIAKSNDQSIDPAM